MKKWLLLVGMIVSLCAFQPKGVAAGPSGSVQCDSYKMNLTGTAVNFGVSYTEHVVLEKVHKSGGVQGKWKLTKYDIFSVYPQPVNIALDQVDHHELGHGMWMDMHSVVSGNTIEVKFIKGNVVLDVVGNRIGYVDTDVWCGTINGRQATFKWHKESPLEPNLKGPVTLQGERIKVEITSPGDNERFCFPETTTGRLSFTATARVTPAKYSDQLVWMIEDIPGSDMVVEPIDRTGPTITVTCKKLPYKNSSFGPKKLYVRLKVGDCEVEATSHVRIYFPAFAANNPGGSEPNWFYYWKQTSAAVGPVRYGGTSHLCSTGASRDLGYYRSTIFDSVYHICNLRNLGDDFPFIAKKDNNSSLGEVKVYGIDTFAVACRHENAHYTHSQSWWKQYHTADKFKDTNRNGILDTQEQLLDKDGDLVPDSIESGLGLDPSNKNTFGIGPDGDDEELLCWMAETVWKIGSADSADWAKPGKQWR
ncbi:MAG: hypothetical protein HKM93_22360 [Desulfobacteraceae bacterium]|nr:hypothetical protein [Desulfobacteraceae bacterium]